HTRWPRDWSSDVCSSDLAGIVAESLAEQDVVRPRLGTADREVGSPVADHGLAGHVFEDGLRAPHIGAKLVGRLPRDQLVTVAVRSEERRVGKEGGCGGGA